MKAIDRSLLLPNLTAAMHVAVFLLIVLGSSGAMLYLTTTSRAKANASEISKPIPELARWSADSR